MRWTGSSGQIVEHQPLLPLRNMPPVNAAVIAPSSSSALQRAAVVEAEPSQEDEAARTALNAIT